MAVSTNHNKQVDVLKGMAMLCVLITHFRWPEQYRLIPVFPFIIEMAVPLFMVLSGYTWTLSYRKNGDSVLELYSPEHLVKKILRFTIPYIPIIIIETYFCGEHMGGGYFRFCYHVYNRWKWSRGILLSCHDSIDLHFSAYISPNKKVKCWWFYSMYYNQCII